MLKKKSARAAFRPGGKNPKRRTTTEAFFPTDGIRGRGGERNVKKNSQGVEKNRDYA